MLVAENSNLVSKIVIGKSYEGRPLDVLKVGHDSWSITVSWFSLSMLTLLLENYFYFRPLIIPVLVEMNE